jgi:hypothetical protein
MKSKAETESNAESSKGSLFLVKSAAINVKLKMG